MNHLHIQNIPSFIKYFIFVLLVLHFIFVLFDFIIMIFRNNLSFIFFIIYLNWIFVNMIMILNKKETFIVLHKITIKLYSHMCFCYSINHAYILVNIFIEKKKLNKFRLWVVLLKIKFYINLIFKYIFYVIDQLTFFKRICWKLCFRVNVNTILVLFVF